MRFTGEEVNLEPARMDGGDEDRATCWEVVGWGPRRGCDTFQNQTWHQQL